MANGHFLLFILRQREKSAISVRKNTNSKRKTKLCIKCSEKRLTAAEEYGTIKCTQTARDVQSGKSAKGGENVMTKCKGAVMMGSLSFRGQAVAGAHRSGD